MKVWNKTTGECLRTIHMTGPVWRLLRLTNNSTFLCGLDDGRVEERRLVNFEALHTLHQHTDAVYSMCEVSGGAVVTASGDTTLKVWDMNSKTVICTLTGHSDDVIKVIQLRGTTTVASGSHDKTVRVWDVTTGNCVRVLQGHIDSVQTLVELRDGTLLSGSYAESIREWNIKGECVATYKLMSEVISMTELRDGSIAIGSLRGEMQVRKTWNTPQVSLSQKCCQVIAKHHHTFDMVNLKQNLPTELCENINRCI
eukprot:TRINITY_DN3639_c0_g3_i2.p1 TRINITY_DN3639_c0_g3~~TRINITY_DN3639_c0_g3_i2.p1  ORF type:complete len:255 (-),score=45.82 TRINITY_DN3639_c0_g3_i2:50-814(-)